MTIDYERLRAANQERQAEWKNSDKADIAFRALEVADEAGELAGAVKKLLRAQYCITGSIMDVDDVAAEIGDTVISLDLLAGDLNIPLVPSNHLYQNSTPASLALSLDSVIGNLSQGVLAHIEGKNSVYQSFETLEFIQSRMSSALALLISIAGALGIDPREAVSAKFDQTSVKYGLQTRFAA